MTETLRSIIDKTPFLLRRSSQCDTTADPKLSAAQPPVYTPWPYYATAMKKLSSHAEVKKFDMARDAEKFFVIDAPHGLLYLPYPYLVPGGRFNEMYGWDTAFPVLAWADIHRQIMREQVDNQLYQIQMYGKVLNANRTYYLSRSQPPMISAMALKIFHAAKDQNWKDFDPEGIHTDARSWLAFAYHDLQKYYQYWTTGDRFIEETGLSRYWDDSDAPAPEVITSEEGHFDHAIAHFRNDNDSDFYDAHTAQLTPLYHRANRAMRASGLDPTGHWGYGALRCMFHVPVCLNALLYRMESDLREMAAILNLPQEEKTWAVRQKQRKNNIQKFMFDEKTGLYHDYDFIKKEKNMAPFATIFHGFWAGLYNDNPANARRAADSILNILETPHGIVMSINKSGSQWDYPYGWPPVQYFAVAGLARAGLHDKAQRIAKKFAALVTKVFEEKGALFEKYNMEEGNAEVHVINGYDINVTENGTFLWTAACLKMIQDYIETGRI